jgi:hypothetical protein
MLTPKTNYGRDIPLENYISRATRGGAWIATARDTLPALRSTPGLTLRDWYKLTAAQILLEIGPEMHNQPVQARILYCRWMVDCLVCAGANDVDPAEPIYLCSCCGWPERFAPVEFPPDRLLIEKILLMRPRICNRNWHPGEPLDMLLEENREHAPTERAQGD